MREYEYDLVVIGAGPGGYEAALLAAGTYGMKTALVEKEALGGTCLNHGCIPTKALLHSADLYRQMKECGTFGLHAENVTFDMGRIQDRKAEVLDTLRSGIGRLMKQNKVECLTGTGKILDAHTVEVKLPGEETRTLSAEHILIASGSKAALPPIPGSDLPGVMVSDELLEKRDGVPGRLLIIGGGVIGMEFASVYSAFGSEVTVLEALPRIIANLDRELSQSLKMLMKKRGVTICTGAMVKEIRKAEDCLECVYVEKDREQSAPADCILICTGRKPYTEGLFGPEVHIVSEKGRILTDENGQTSVPGIYAIGDVTGGVMLAHAATAMGMNAVAVMNHVEPPVNLSVIPSCIYTDPEIASAGLTAEEAALLGIEAQSRKIVMSANGKTVLSAQERGFIKVVYEKEGHRILGVQMMCARASDMISEFAEAIVHGLTMEQMAGVVRPHPTFSEAITEACRLEPKTR